MADFLDEFEVDSDVDIEQFGKVRERYTLRLG